GQRPAATGEARVDQEKTARVPRDGGRHAAGRDLETTRSGLDRRQFLTGAATGAAAFAVVGADAQTTSTADGASPAVPAPSPRQIERDAGDVRPPAAPPRAAVRPGSDLMVQVLKELG